MSVAAAYRVEYGGALVKKKKYVSSIECTNAVCSSWSWLQPPLIIYIRLTYKHHTKNGHKNEAKNDRRQQHKKSTEKTTLNIYGKRMNRRASE